MELRKYIREMVETELNEMAAIATLEKIKSPEKLEKFKKLYAGNENSLTSRLIDAIERGSYKIANAEKAESDPDAQEVISFINKFNSKPGFKDHPIPVAVIEKEFGDVSDLVSAGILSKVDGATRNGLLVATNKSHTAGISPNLRQLSSAGILSNPKEEGEYIVPKKEKPESSGAKGRPTSEKTLIAQELKSKLEADSNYKPSEDELETLGSEFIEKLRSRIDGTLKRGPKNALKNAMMALGNDDEDTNGDGIVDDEDLDVEKLEESIKKQSTKKQPVNEQFLKMQKLAGLITESEFKSKLNENESSDLKVEWTPEYYEATKNYGDEAYDEKGLANGFQMRDGKKVKEIVGYYVPEDAENENDEEFDVIGYIYSTSGKDIETEYSEDELDNAFDNALRN